LIALLTVVSILIIILLKKGNETQEYLQAVLGQYPSKLKVPVKNLPKMTELTEAEIKKLAAEKPKKLQPESPKEKRNVPSIEPLDANAMKKIVDGQKCKIPTLNPWDPEVLPAVAVKPKLEKCTNIRYGVVKKNKLILKARNVLSAFMYYIIRVTDFQTKFSERIQLCGERDKPCWEECGNKGGACPKVCGENGYCCRKGLANCTNVPATMLSESSHSCIKWNVGGGKGKNKPCWEECGNKGGPCPKVCGENGFCCRKGFANCTNVPSTMLSESTHSCIKWSGDEKNNNCYIEQEITDEYIKLVIVFSDRTQHEEYHYSFPDKSKEWGISKTPPEDQLNVMVVLVDSLSHSMVQRSMKETYKYLSEHPRTVIMKGHTIVADGTTGQLTAMLTGVPERDHPEARRGFPGTGPVDRWNFIYNDLKKRNYVSLYSEEGGSAGTFHYRLTGFNKIPSTHFPRQLWRTMSGVVYKQLSCPHQFHFRYLREYYEAYKDYNKFTSIFLNIMHGVIGTVENADHDLVELLKHVENSDHGKNTVVIFMGDHGLRTSAIRKTLTGKMEERLPMLSITYPPKFESSQTKLKNLRINSHLLTSHFDLHQTFHHLTTFPHLNDNVHKHKLGRSLFTDISKLNRSCVDAGVDNHWCTCLKYEKVDATKDKYVNQLIDKILKFVNDRNEKAVPGKCHKLQLKNVILAGRRTPNNEVNQFKYTSTNKGGCDSCQVEYDKSKDFSRFVYEVQFIATPKNMSLKSYPTYDSGGEINTSNNEIKVGQSVSRISLYGNQPACIAAEYPHLRGYCVCKDFKETS